MRKARSRSSRRNNGTTRARRPRPRIQLWPDEPEAIRAVARFLSRTRQPQALEFWERLEKKGRLSRTDLMDEASIALLAGDDGRAKRAIAALLSGKEGAAKPVDHLLEAQLAIRQGAPIEAHDALQKVFGDSAATSREKLQAALIELAIAGGNEAWRDDAWSWLKKLADQNDAAGLDALTVLAQTIVAQEKVPDHFPATAPDLARETRGPSPRPRPAEIARGGFAHSRTKRGAGRIDRAGDRALENRGAGRPDGAGDVVERQSRNSSASWTRSRSRKHSRRAIFSCNTSTPSAASAVGRKSRSCSIAIPTRSIRSCRKCIWRAATPSSARRRRRKITGSARSKRPTAIRKSC